MQKEQLVIGKAYRVTEDNNGNYAFTTGSSISGFARYRTSDVNNETLGSATSATAVVVIRE